jgi:ATP-binding cassette subfamily F protein uup
VLGQGAAANLSGDALTVACDGRFENDLAARRSLSRLGVEPDAQVESMSGGEIRRTLLARALAAPWNLLLLDEPTNHLDIETIEWLEQELRRSTQSHTRAIVFVSHDRAFSRAVATRVVALDRAALYSFPGSYDTFVERRLAAERAEMEQQAEFDKQLAREEAWLRRGVKARRTRNEGRVRALEGMRDERAARREKQGTAALSISSSERSGDIVIAAEGLSFAYEDRAIIESLDTTVYRGERVGVAGPNGSGKTTLVRLLLRELTPASGTVRHGAALEVIYFDQMRRTLDESASLYNALGDGYDTIEVNGRSKHVLAYMQEFLFSPDDRNRPVDTFSGGERNRLLLAKLFARRSNVLVLDEPTNDLDAETLELLEDALIDYPGTIILVTHDRDFLDAVVTSSLILPGDGRVLERAGGFRDWSETYRREVVRTRPAAAGATEQTANSAETRRARRRRRTFREKEELAELPARIEAMESEREHIHAKLSDPALYQSDTGEAAAALSARLETLEDELETAYARWGELDEIPE